MRVSIEEAISRGWITAQEIKPQAKPAKGKHKPTRRDIEGESQATMLEEFRLSYPDFAPYLIHIPNGGSRKNAFEGYRLKRQGVRKGVSDLFLPVPRGHFHGLWIEFKAEPPFDAPVTEEQLEWIEMMKQQDYAAYVCLGVTEAMDTLKDYLSLPPFRLM